MSAALLVIVPWAFSAFFAAWSIYLKGHGDHTRMLERQADKFAMQDERIRQLELELARHTSPLMKQVQDLLSAGLHHPDPTHSRSDLLLEKLDQTTLTAQELPELLAILDRRIQDPTTPTAEIEAARALKALMPLVVMEAALQQGLEEKQRAAAATPAAPAD